MFELAVHIDYSKQCSTIYTYSAEEQLPWILVGLLISVTSTI